MVIMLIGLLTRRGFYRPDDLQVFTRGQRGGATGSSTAGTGAEWAPGFPARQPAWPSSTCRGNSSGPLGELAGGIDLKPAGRPRPGRPALPGTAAPVPGTALRLRPARTALGTRARHAEGLR
ncbi:hypothetical protein P4133_06860 [Pseudomonas aeruginosa]|nr:hypothetical protein [Pseudomonas aeruginosa]